MALQPFETAEAEEFPTCRQLSVFVENRVGQLLSLLRVFSDTQIRILALSIVHSVDCAIVRLVVDDPDAAIRRLKGADFATTVSDVIVLELPRGGSGLLQVCSALLRAEVNLHYAYPLLTQPHRQAALAINVDNVEMAGEVLAQNRIVLLSESELREEPGGGERQPE
jgi:hypothetical protein